MIFKRIGAKKHKYELQITLSTIKYCPWDSSNIVIMLIRGDNHVQSPHYPLKKGRCNLNNNQLTLPCTMYYSDQQYLSKDAQIKIKSFNQQQNKLGSTLSKIKFDLVKYTEQDRPYEQQLQFDGAKLSCSIYMKILDDDAITQQTNTQASHLSIKTQKIGKKRDKTKQRSRSQERNTYQFGKSNKVIKQQEYQKQASEIKPKKKDKERKDFQQKLKVERKKNKTEYMQSNTKQQYTQQLTADTKAKKNTITVKQFDAQILDQRPKKRQKLKNNQQQVFFKKDQKDDKSMKNKNLYPQISHQNNFHDALQLFSPVTKKPEAKTSQGRQYIFRKEIQQKDQQLNRLKQQNQNLKQLLESRLNSQPVQMKQSESKITRLQQQNQKLKQKLIQRQIQLSQYEIKQKTTRQRQSQLQQKRKDSTLQAHRLRQQLQEIKNKIAYALTSAFQSGDSSLIDFVQEHFSSE